MVAVHVLQRNHGHAMKTKVQLGIIRGESYDSSKFYCISVGSSPFNTFSFLVISLVLVVLVLMVHALTLIGPQLSGISHG